MSKLSKSQRRALNVLAQRESIGPHPDSQTDGVTITASVRHELLRLGYATTRKATDIDDVKYYRDGADNRVAAENVAFIPTHWWSITEAGRTALTSGSISRD